MKTFLSSFLCILLSLATWSQEPDLEQLGLIELELQMHFAGMQEARTDDAWNTQAEAIQKSVRDAVNTPGCFDYPFDKVKGMGILSSPDGKLKLFNWSAPQEDNTHKYYGIFLHRPDKKSGIIDVHELVHDGSLPQGTVTKYLDGEEWYGALYYEIIPIKKGKNTIYTLLGWAGMDGLTTMKLIDAIQFTSRGIRLGAPIFKTDNGIQKRFLLEYADDVSASLRWFEKDKRLIFDHLSPRNPSLQGQHSFYGPDFTFDAFVLEKGKWIFQRDVYITMEKDKRPFNDPRKR